MSYARSEHAPAEERSDAIQQATGQTSSQLLMLAPSIRSAYLVRMSRDLTPEQIGDNEDAARAMFSLIGGLPGYFSLPPDSRLADFAGILNADPDDDLSGLRLIASRMEYGTSLGIRGPQASEAADRFVEPEVARWWLQAHGRAEILDGTLSLRPNPGHVALAAYSIANGEEGVDLYDAYVAATDAVAPLSRDVITDIARKMTDGYFSARE